MTDLDAAPALTLSDGIGLLSVQDRALSVAVVEKLEVVLGDLRLPPEQGAPEDRVRNRRGKLRVATIVADGERIARYLAACDLGDAGLSDVRVRLTTGGARVAARATFGGRTVDLTARVLVSPADARKVRLSVTDVQLYGFLPVPAAAVAGALTAALTEFVTGGRSGDRMRGAVAQARPTSRSHLDVDVLDLALLEIFAGSGWRLPDSSATALTTAAFSDGKITLHWGDAVAVASAAGGDTTAAQTAATTATTADGEGAATTSAIEEADGLLARGNYAAALARYRDALYANPADDHAGARVLELLGANPVTLAEADTLAAEMLERQPRLIPALLTRAIAAAERGDIGEAARRFGELGQVTDAQGDADGAAFARAAGKSLPVPAEAPAAEAPLAETAPSDVPNAKSLEELCELLVARGDLGAADDVFEARLAVAPDEVSAAIIATERARIRLLGPDGAAAALAVLRDIPLPWAPEEGLILRADLGERQASTDDAVPALNELLTRARATGDAAMAQELADRITGLLARNEGRDAVAATAEDLEEALATNPTDPAVAEELARLYSQIEDPTARIEALASLLRRALGLSAESRKKMYMNLGESAEATGDLDSAEQAYWRAATIEAEPALRANYLVCHARVLLAREEVQTAIVELEEAIGRVPDHAGALALLAEISFRTQDWARARQLYTVLEAAPNVADVISREQLMFRRAALADGAGDDEEAEACYREVAILNSRHVEARRALAEIALRRRDLGGAALRLEEVLRLLPLDALDDLLNVRQRLGSIYVQLEDWGSARYYLELVLAQDPARVSALELLVDVYQRHGLYKDAAEACERLARLYFEPSRRAQILYRQGEILRAHVGDHSGASNAFLKASDLDPRFVPTMIRLVEYFWNRGELETLAEVATELRAAGVGPPPDAANGAGTSTESAPQPAAYDAELIVRMAVGSAIAAGEARPEWNLGGLPWNAVLAARSLAEVAAHLRARPPHELDAGLSVLVKWEGDGLAVTLTAALKELVLQDPSSAGPVRALAWVADRREQLALARALYGILVFIDPDDGAAGRLAELGPAPAADAVALRAGGTTDHSDAREPLRPVLLALAAPLQGWPGQPAPAGAEARGGGGEGLRPARAAGLRRLGQLLQAPPFTVTVESSSEPPAARAIAVVAGRPTVMRVGNEAASLPEREWGFVAAQALDHVRAGTTAVAGLSEDGILGLLRGTLAALTGAAPPSDPEGKATAAVEWLTHGDPATELPVGPERTRLVENIQVALYAAVKLEAFLRGCAHTANRIGLLICASPIDALKALARLDALVSAVSDPDTRRGFVRTSAVRELCRYMVSDDYAKALVAAE